MSAHILISDELSTGKTIREFVLELLGPRLTARELIVQRVRSEVARFNDNPNADCFEGLVQPSDTEILLNGTFRLRRQKWVDADDQCRKALEAFERNGFLLLVSDRQVESLDEALVVAPETRAVFVKLVQLVGG